MVWCCLWVLAFCASQLKVEQANEPRSQLNWFCAQRFSLLVWPWMFQMNQRHFAIHYCRWKILPCHDMSAPSAAWIRFVCTPRHTCRMHVQNGTLEKWRADVWGARPTTRKAHLMPVLSVDERKSLAVGLQRLPRC